MLLAGTLCGTRTCRNSVNAMTRHPFCSPRLLTLPISAWSRVSHRGERHFSLSVPASDGTTTILRYPLRSRWLRYSQTDSSAHFCSSRFYSHTTVSDFAREENHDLAAWGVKESCKRKHDSSTLTATVLAKQNYETSQAVIDGYADNASFQKLSKHFCIETIQRDMADSQKLTKGIRIAVRKGVLPPRVQVEPTRKMFVAEKRIDAVASDIIDALGAAPSAGCIVTLQGKSGTGKGSIVEMLKGILPNSDAWSNGNIFRSLTLLALTYAEQNDCCLQDALEPHKLNAFFDMLEFDKFGKDAFDIKITGLGLEYYVSEIEKTILKGSKVSTNIPVVAEATQGEVIIFVLAALEKMVLAGRTVFVEGRSQTLDYIRTPHRFELILEDAFTIGERQAAMRVSAVSWEKVRSVHASMDVVKSALDSAVAELVEQV